MHDMPVLYKSMISIHVTGHIDICVRLYEQREKPRRLYSKMFTLEMRIYHENEEDKRGIKEISTAKCSENK
jgi:hypothetical protein